MGLDYSINLHFPTLRLKDALTALAEFAEPVQDRKTTVHLPCGRAIALPFTSRFKSGTVTLQWGGGEGKFDTSLRFLCDDAIRDGNYAHTVELVDGVEYAGIGYIYLTVRVGCLYSELSFMAATTGMSRLFVNSVSIRNRFLDLLATAGGVVGWLDQETCEYFRLDDPAQTIVPEWTAPPDRLSARSSADRDTAGLCGGLGHPLHEVEAVLACRSESAVGLASVIRHQRAFDLLPVLADALEEAGCIRRDVLDHLRVGGPHKDGCWVADLLLGDGL